MAERDVTYREGVELDFPIYQATKIEMGALVCLRSDGYAVEGANTSGYHCVGVAVATVDNTSGSSGDKRVVVRCRRMFRLLNSAGNALVAADAGTLCFVEDDGHVCNATGGTNKVIAGVVGGNITATTVEVYIQGRAQYAESSTVDFAVGQDLAVTRNASVGGTFGATGVATLAGRVNANGGIDRSTAAALALGATTASAVEVGKAGAATTVKGGLVVDQTLTQTGVATFTLPQVVKHYSQAGEPDTTACPANSFCFWTDTDDSALYLCFNQAGTVKTVALT